MNVATNTKPSRRPSPAVYWLGVCLFTAVALFFLWEEHQAHIMGALPYVLLMLCPAMHLLMHRGHGHRGHRSGGES